MDLSKLRIEEVLPCPLATFTRPPRMWCRITYCDVLPQVIGARVLVKIQSGEEYEGSIFSYDPSTQYLILETVSAKTRNKDYRFLKAGIVSAVTWLAEPQEPLAPLPAVTIEEIVQRRDAGGTSHTCSRDPSVPFVKTWPS